MFSHQPGVRIPRRCGPFPGRDDYVAYLQNYAAGMRLLLGTRVDRVDRVDRADGGWELRLDGGSIGAAHVVIATGPDAEPVMPSWPGMADYPGTVIHAGQFRNVADLAAWTCSWWAQATPARTCWAIWPAAMRASCGCRRARA